MSNNYNTDKDNNGGGSWFSTLSSAVAAAGLAVYHWMTYKSRKIEGMEKEIQKLENYIQCSQLQVLERLLVERQNAFLNNFRMKSYQEELEKRIRKETISLNIPEIQKNVEQIMEGRCSCHWARDKSHERKLMWEKVQSWKKTLQCAECEDFKKVLQDHNE